MIDLRSKIREVQDFPTPGVGFKDFTPLLADAQALRDLQRLAELAGELSALLFWRDLRDLAQ